MSRTAKTTISIPTWEQTPCHRFCGLANVTCGDMAKQLQKALPEPQTIAHIFEHLDYDGQYQPQRLEDADMFCERIDPITLSEYQKSYAQKSLLEMRITLDHNDCLLEYNPNCSWCRTINAVKLRIFKNTP